MEKFSLDLKDIIHDDYTGTLVRLVDLRIRSSSTNCFIKIPRYNIDPFLGSIKLPINEVYIQLTFEEIKNIDYDNGKRNLFINRYLRPKIRTDKINIPLIDIEINRKPSIKEMEQISQFVVDIVYAHPYIALAVPPKITLPTRIPPMEKCDLFKNQVAILSETLKSYFNNVQLAYFIPDYIPRAILPELIEDYVGKFGEEALLVLDVNGKRFSTGGYSDVSLIHREMKRHQIENYAIYLFNHKGRKRSGKEVPSEDLLALLNGANLIGPNRKVIPLPRYILEKRKSSLGKIFSSEDFLFYPEKEAPNAEEFQRFANLGKSKYKMLQIFNDININFSAKDLSKNPTLVISNLKRPQFKDTLKVIAKKRDSIMNQQSLGVFF